MAAEQHDMTQAAVHVLSKRRLIAGYWLAQAVFVALFGPFWIMQGDTVAGPEHPLGVWHGDRIGALLLRWDYWGSIGVVILALMLMQAVIVWPVRRPRFRKERGWPLWLSIGAATLVGTMLAAGIALALLNLVMLKLVWFEGDDERVLGWVIAAWCLLSYVGGFVLLLRFCRRGLDAGRRHETLLGRIAATLFVGTLVEAVAILPLDVMFRRKADCYCFAGTFWAYTLLTAAGLVTIGPAIFLPALARRRKRWYGGVCDCCGYDMSGLDARSVSRCPECGAGWKADRAIPESCEACRYSLAGIAPVDGAIVCPECGRANRATYPRP